MRSTSCDFAFVSDNRLLSEAIGSALVDAGVVKSFLHIRAGHEIHDLQAMLHAPALIVLDERSYPENASLYARIQRLAEEFTASRIVVIGEGDCTERVTGCVVSGASTFVLASDSLSDLAITINALKAGHCRCNAFVIEAILHKVRELSAAKHVEAGVEESTLTQREIEVLVLVEQGIPNKEIASRLGIAVSTVKNHLHAIFEKFDVTERRQAVRRGIAMGLLTCQARDAVA